MPEADSDAAPQPFSRGYTRYVLGVVFLVMEDDKGTKVEMRPVELGEAFGLRFEVLKGLKPGDRVVIRGNERLRPGQKVRIQSTDGGRKGRRGSDKRDRGKRGANGKRGGS